MKAAIDGGGGSNVATTGVTKVGGSTQFTSLAVPTAVSPIVPVSAAPSSSPTSFIGPIPATATRTATGYTTASGTSVNPNPTPAWSGSATAADNNASKLNTSILNSTPSSASSTVTSYSPATTLAGTVTKTTAAQRAAASQQFKGFLGELTGVPAAGRLATGRSPRIGASVLPGAAAKAVGVGLDIASAVPVIGAAGKGLAAVGALGKTAKAVGAADAALKGGKALKDVTGTKIAPIAAAATLAVSPVTHAAYDVGKATTAITQTAKAGKAAKTIDTFVPSAAKAASKETSSIAKSVEAAPKKVSTTEFSAATKAKTADAVAKAKTVSSVVTASKAGASTNTKVKAPTSTADAAYYQAKANDNKTSNFNNEINKSKEGKGGSKVDKPGTGIDYGFKGKKAGDNDIVKAQDGQADVVNDVINYKKPFEANQVSDGGDGGTNKEPTPKEKEKTKKRRIPHVKIKGQGGQWRPSSIV
jgi:hypothetical protein